MVATIRCARFGGRATLLGETEIVISPVREAANRRALLFEPGQAANATTREAAELAGLTISATASREELLHCLETDRPDLIIVSGADQGEPDPLLDEIEAARRTEKMPVLFVADEAPRPAGNHANFDWLSPGANLSVMFLAIRALLRRERPWVLEEVRAGGTLELDEASFRLSDGNRTAPLNKVDLSILGPFFDAPGHVFDRAMLQRLAYGPRQWKEGSRLIDGGVCKTRRLLKRHLGHDPIQTVRGVGYHLVS